MPEQKIVQDPQKNAFQVGIAFRLKVDPRRVNCFVNPGEGGAFNIKVQVDGRDLNVIEQRIVDEYLQEQFPNISVRIIDG
jgi:hypothetical protein